MVRPNPVGVIVGADMMFNDPKSAMKAGHHRGVPSEALGMYYWTHTHTHTHIYIFIYIFLYIPFI